MKKIGDCFQEWLSLLQGLFSLLGNRRREYRQTCGLGCSAALEALAAEQFDPLSRGIGIMSPYFPFSKM
jgi:hypothetical protein